MKDFVKAIHVSIFKLCMFFITVNKGDPTYIFYYNEILVKNDSKVDSILNNNHISITYHVTHWDVYTRVLYISWIRPKNNLADALKKVSSEDFRYLLFGNWIY